MKSECPGTNTVNIKLKLCCDIRKRECRHAVLIKSDNLNVCLCTRKADKIKEQ